MKFKIDILRGMALWGLLLVFPGFLYAQNDLGPKVSGFTELDHISYFNKEDRKINGRNQGILQLELSGSAKDVSYFGAIEFRNDITDPTRNRIWTDELYITYKAKNYDLFLGKKIHTWGSTDSFSPVNVINPVDYSDLLDTDDETIGIYSANIKYYWGQYYLEGIFIPVFEPAVIPSYNSRWLPQQSGEAFMSDGEMVPIRYSQNPDRTVEKDIRSYQYAFRFGGSWKGIDYNINYFNGYDDIPYFHRTPEFTGDSLIVGITKTYHKMDMVGIDVTTVLGGMVLKGEWAYIHQNAPGDQDWFMGSPFHYGVVGIDKNVTDFIGNVDLLLNVQYIYQKILSDYEVNSFNFNHIFQNAIMGRVDLGFTNRFKLQTTGVYDFAAGHYIVIPELNLKPEGGFKISVKSYFTGGDKESLFGSYSNDRLQVIAKYYF